MAGTSQHELGLPFGGFLCGLIAISILITWLYNNTGGSLWTAILFHWIFTFASQVLSSGVTRSPSFNWLEYLPYMLMALIISVVWRSKIVVLTDIRMPPTNTDEGIRMAEALRSSAPSIGVVVLSQYADAEYALALLDKGAAGRAYLLKERVSDLDQLINAIREVARGGSVVDTKVIENLIAERSRNKRSALADLTLREREVLASVAEGKNNAAIARALHLTDGAVEKHISAIFSKLGLTEEPAVHRRVKATLIYLAEEPIPEKR